MKVPKIKSKKASELIKTILKKKNLQYILPEIRGKKKTTFHWENITPNNSSPV